MKNTVASGSFFAFLAMVLVGVCVVLLMNAPAPSSIAATNGYGYEGEDGGYDAIEPADAPPVVDAQVEYNDVHDHTNS